MTIRTRLILWFASVLFLSLLAMGAMSYYEFVIEPRISKEPLEENLVGEVVEVLAWCGLPALAVGLGGGWWLMRKALGPVTSLTLAAEQMNEHNLGKTLPRSG